MSMQASLNLGKVCSIVNTSSFGFIFHSFVKANAYNQSLKKLKDLSRTKDDHYPYKKINDKH